MAAHLQAALKAFDDDRNGALDAGEFERFAKSLMRTGAATTHAATHLPAGHLEQFVK